MSDSHFIYHTELDETGLDTMGHINHAYYLSLGEQARWAWATQLGVGQSHIKATGVGWVILEAHVKYLSELHVGDQIQVSCELKQFKHKVGRIEHRVCRDETTCATLEVVFGFFDLQQRKLVVPDQKIKAAFQMY